MGRPPVKDRFKAERCLLASMIDEALKAGQKPHPTSGVTANPWTDTAFAKVLSVSQSMVNDWRNREDPTRPVAINPILEALYGDNPDFAAAKHAMKTAWKRAAGIEEDDPPDLRKIVEKQFSAVANVVTLLGNQPTPDNKGNQMLPYTLRFHRDEGIAIGIRQGGKAVTVTMDIALTKALFLVESKGWQPLQDTIFRKKKHANAAPGPVGDSLWIVNSKDNHGRIVGEPLDDEPHILMERRGGADDGPIVLSVMAPRDGFDVQVPDGTLSTTQNDVLDAIFAEAIPRDNRNRLEIACVTIAPNAAKART